MKSTQQATQIKDNPKEYQQTGQGRRIALSPVTLVFILALTFVLGLLTGTLLVQGTAPGKASVQAGAAQSQQAPAQQAAAPQAAQQAAPEVSQHIADLEARVLKDPSNRPLLVELGNAYFDTGSYAKAIQAYEAALALNANDAGVLTDCGVMYRAVGQYEKALEKFARAREVEPGHAFAMFNAGVVLNYDLHRHDEALQIWRELLRLHPDMTTPDGRSIETFIKQVESDKK